MGKMKMRKPGRVVVVVNISLDLDDPQERDLYQAISELAKKRIMAPAIKSQLLNGNGGLKIARTAPPMPAAVGSFAI